MADTRIENLVINSPFEEPKRHFRFTEDGLSVSTGWEFSRHGTSF